MKLKSTGKGGSSIFLVGIVRFKDGLPMTFIVTLRDVNEHLCMALNWKKKVRD